MDLLNEHKVRLSRLSVIFVILPLATIVEVDRKECLTFVQQEKDFQEP